MGFCAPDKDQSGRRAGRSQCRSAGTPDKAKASGIWLHQPTLHAFDDSYANNMLVESVHRASRLTLTFILSVSSCDHWGICGDADTNCGPLQR